MNAAILGASFDKQDANKKFREEQEFPYPLLCDVDKTAGTTYGAARPPDDEWAAVPKRLTFLISPDGTIAKTYDVKDVAAHPDEVLDDLRALAG